MVIVFATLAVGLVVSAMFLIGATSKPSIPVPRRQSLIRVYSAHGCEVWVRSDRAVGPRAFRMTDETRDYAAEGGAASVS